jgi:CheY-like chemotaxis protein
VTSASALSAQRPIRILVLATAMVIIALAAMSFIIASNLRQDALTSGEIALRRHTLALAGQADRSFQSIDLILSSINDQLSALGVFDGASYRVAMGGRDTFEFLQGKLAGLPQLDAITMIDSTGKLINFSRYWPIPDVNVSDRDYFAALRDNPDMLTFVGKPVQNRGTGTWTIYIARRVNGVNSQFSGLILAAMSLQYFEEFYRSISLGEGSSAALLRDDGTLLARYPKTPDVGKVFASSKAAAQLRSTGGFVREMSPIDNVMRLKNSQKLSGFPLLVQYARLPIVASTANAFADDREACEQAGMTDFVAKPVRKKFLIQATVRALRRSRVENPGDTPGVNIAAAGSAVSAVADVANSEVLDPAAFEGLVAEIDMDGAMETFKIFAADTRRLLDGLSKVELETSRKRVQVEAHSLKSTAATFGLQRLAALAKQLEHQAMAIPEPEFLSVVPQLDQAFEEGLVQFEEAFRPAA